MYEYKYFYVWQVARPRFPRPIVVVQVEYSSAPRPVDNFNRPWLRIPGGAPRTPLVGMWSGCNQ